MSAVIGGVRHVPYVPIPKLGQLGAMAARARTWAWKTTAAALSHRAGRLALLIVLTLTGIAVMNVVLAEPAFAECAPPGVPNAAGSGMPGFFDPATANSSGQNYYGQNGFGGLRWNNCELGGPIAGNEMAGDPNAGLDTWFGNLFMGLATWLAGLSTGIHKWIGNSSELLAPMDSIIVELSKLTRTVLVDNWMGVALLGGAVVMLVAVLAGNRRKAFGIVATAVLSLTFVGLMDTIPLTIAHSVDGLAANVQAETDAAALKEAGITATKEEALGAIYVDQLIWPQWAEGTTGAKNAKASPSRPGSDASTEDLLFQKSVTGFAENGKVSADDRRKEFTTTAEKLKTSDSAKFQTLKGQSYNRASAGFLALVKVAPVAVYRIPGEAGIFLTQLMMRLVPIVGPAFALAMLIPSFREKVNQLVRKLLSAVIHTIILAFFTAIHVATVAFFFNKLDPGLAVVATLVLTVAFWMISNPLGIFTTLIPGLSHLQHKQRNKREERRERREERRESRRYRRDQGEDDDHTGGYFDNYGDHGELKDGSGKYVPVPDRGKVGPMPLPGGAQDDQERLQDRSSRLHEQQFRRREPGTYRDHPLGDGMVSRPRPHTGPNAGFGSRIGENARRYGTVTPWDGHRSPAAPDGLGPGSRDRHQRGRDQAPVTDSSQGRQRFYIGSVSDEEARERGFFVPPRPGHEPLTGGQGTGESRNPGVRFFVPPESSEVQSDSGVRV